MPVDSFAYEETYYGLPYLSPDQGGWVPDYDDNPSWWDLAQYGIGQAAQTAQIIGSGYPPGSTNVYAPQTSYPSSTPTPMPYPSPTTPLAPGVTAQPSSGIQLSQTTLMLLVGGVLLFMLGTKKGR